MKYKFIGRNNSFCIELIAYDIVPKGEYLKTGQVIDVPNDKETVIKALDASGVFKRVQNNFKVNKKLKRNK